jgi:hypothetical protein
MPSDILVNNLGLTYKGSIGVSTATLPDVCKTPTPGGPVPIPYPNFADQSSLDKGSKTVKAHGNMIAIKGSEYSLSSGDEPGTVGGVTSNTFKKETAWITYSFDVKMDGQNACRHTDKKFHNHKNTVDLAGNIDPSTGVIVLTCEEGWNDCQKKQMKAKAAKMNAVAKKRGGLKTRRTAGKLRDRADAWAAKFAQDWKKLNPNESARTLRWPDSSNPSKQKTHFYHDCAKTDDPLGANMQADHVQEVQLGGGVRGPFLWLDGEVNGASGRQIKAARDQGITNPTGFSTKNC